MWENNTYKNILARCLARIDDKYDKREGSVIYDAIAPACFELEQMYVAMQLTLDETFADTASRPYLMRRAAERGLEPTEASCAVVLGSFIPTDVEIEAGTKFTCKGYTFVVLCAHADEENNEPIAGQYELSCETEGAAPNSIIGTLVPVDSMPDLASASIVSLITAGEDEEDTEHFRERYLYALTNEATSGNIAWYKETVANYSGVGSVKIVPAWNGAGTVKVIITDTDNAAPTSALTSAVKEYLDPVSNAGSGEGLAPIGHNVTVVGVTNASIGINIKNITYDTGASWDDVSEYITAAIDSYMSDLRSEWSESDTVVVRAAVIMSDIMDVDGVSDVDSVTISYGSNTNTQRISLTGEYVAATGTITHTDAV